jgi:hypothetical protein
VFLCYISSVGHSGDFLLSSELRMGFLSESKSALSHHSAFPRILHAVFLACLKSKPENRLVNGRFFGGAVFQQAAMYSVQASSEEIPLY